MLVARSSQHSPVLSLQEALAGAKAWSWQAQPCKASFFQTRAGEEAVDDHWGGPP
jgi:hypothetical protein